MCESDDNDDDKHELYRIVRIQLLFRSNSDIDGMSIECGFFLLNNKNHWPSKTIRSSQNLFEYYDNYLNPKIFTMRSFVYVMDKKTFLAPAERKFSMNKNSINDHENEQE